MGAAAHVVSEGLESLGPRWAALLLGGWYAILLALHVIGVVVVFSNSTGPHTFAFAAVLIGAIGHFSVLFLGVALFAGFQLFPVWPKLAFLIADWLAAVIAALTVGAGSVNEQLWPVVGNVTLGLVMVLQLYKCLVVGCDVDSLLTSTCP